MRKEHLQWSEPVFLADWGYIFCASWDVFSSKFRGWFLVPFRFFFLSLMIAETWTNSQSITFFKENGQWGENDPPEPEWTRPQCSQLEETYQVQCIQNHRGLPPYHITPNVRLMRPNGHYPRQVAKWFGDGVEIEWPKPLAVLGDPKLHWLTSWDRVYWWNWCEWERSGEALFCAGCEWTDTSISAQGQDTSVLVFSKKGISPSFHRP